MKQVNLLLFSLLLLWACQPEQTEVQSGEWIATAPAGKRPSLINIAGETIIPNGRVIAPHGNTVRVTPHTYGLALSPDGKIAITANSGTRPLLEATF